LYFAGTALGWLYGGDLRSSAIPLLSPLPLGEGEGEGGKLLHIISVAHPIVPEDVAVVPEFLDNSGRSY
jgi:hypothetical protein